MTQSVDTGQTRHRWRFRIGDALPADDPVARFIVAVAVALNDSLLSNTRSVAATESYERIYFFNLATSHLYEASETLRKAHREWQAVRDFVAALDSDRKAEFDRISELASPNPPWPGERLKVLRNSFFHYLRLDRAAADAGQLPLARGLESAASDEGVLVIEPGRELSGIRAVFADEIAIKALTADFDEGELERLIEALVQFQGDLSRFAQAAIGRYLRELPAGVVTYETE